MARHKGEHLNSGPLDFLSCWLYARGHIRVNKNVPKWYASWLRSNMCRSSLTAAPCCFQQGDHLTLSWLKLIYQCLLVGDSWGSEYGFQNLLSHWNLQASYFHCHLEYYWSVVILAEEWAEDYCTTDKDLSQMRLETIVCWGRSLGKGCWSRSRTAVCLMLFDCFTFYLIRY